MMKARTESAPSTASASAAALDGPVPAELREKVLISPTGLEVRGDLSFEEWSALAPRIGTALRSMAVVIGDWLVYGEGRFGRIPGERYHGTTAVTGVDYAVLRNYAYVSRKVPRERRHERLSWEHHKAVARLAPELQQRWLGVAANPADRLTSRRLRASIIRGRVVAVEEMAVPPSERGIQNHVPHINRLSGWWLTVGGRAWLKTRTRDQLAAIRRDFQPVLDIVGEIDRAMDGETSSR